MSQSDYHAAAAYAATGLMPQHSSLPSEQHRARVKSPPFQPTHPPPSTGVRRPVSPLPSNKSINAPALPHNPPPIRAANSHRSYDQEAGSGNQPLTTLHLRPPSSAPPPIQQNEQPMKDLNTAEASNTGGSQQPRRYGQIKQFFTSTKPPGNNQQEQGGQHETASGGTKKTSANSLFNALSLGSSRNSHRRQPSRSMPVSPTGVGQLEQQTGGRQQQYDAGNNQRHDMQASELPRPPQVVRRASSTGGQQRAASESSDQADDNNSPPSSNGQSVRSPEPNHNRSSVHSDSADILSRSSQPSPSPHQMALFARSPSPHSTNSRLSNPSSNTTSMQFRPLPRPTQHQQPPQQPLDSRARSVSRQSLSNYQPTYSPASPSPEPFHGAPAHDDDYPTFQLPSRDHRSASPQQHASSPSYDMPSQPSYSPPPRQRSDASSRPQHLQPNNNEQRAEAPSLTQTAAGLFAGLRHLLTGSPTTQYRSNLPPLTMQSNTRDVAEWVHAFGAEYDQYIPSFQQNGVTGESLLTVIDDGSLQALGVDQPQHRQSLLAEVDRLKSNFHRGSIIERPEPGALGSRQSSQQQPGRQSLSHVLNNIATGSSQQHQQQHVPITSSISPSQARATASTDCIICFSGPKTILFEPCMHLCCCLECASNISLTQCPVCRTAIQQRKRVYL